MTRHTLSSRTVVVLAVGFMSVAALAAQSGIAPKRSSAEHGSPPAFANSLADVIAKAPTASFHHSLPPWPSPPPPDLNGVHFITSSVGYGATGNGDIIKTTDGGRMWRVVQSAPSAVFDHLSWNGDVGVASGLSAPAIPTLAITLNDGRTWRVIHPTLPASILQANGLVAHALSPRVMVLTTSAEAFTVGMTNPMFLSTDGGSNFHIIPMPGWQATGGFAALSTTTAALTAVSAHGYGILRLSVVDRRINPLVNGIQTPMYALDFVQPGTLYIGGGNYCKFGVQPAQAIWRLTLGDPRSLQTIASLHGRQGSCYQPIVDLSVTPGGAIYALQGGATQGANLPAPGHLMVSHNGGRSFTVTKASGSSFSRIGSRTWVVTSDGSWAFTREDSGPDLVVRANTEENVTHLAVATQMGGAIWTEWPSKSIGYISTSRGLLRTTNAGLAWTAVKMPIASSVAPIHYIWLTFDRIVSWQNTLSETPILRESLDGGRAWKPIVLPRQVSAIDSVNALPNGFIAVAGQSTQSIRASLYVSRNGGRVWSTVPHPFGDFLGITVHFLNASLGYAASATGQYGNLVPYLFQTTDGGRVWRPLPLGPWTWLHRTDLATSDGAVLFTGLIYPPGSHTQRLTFNDMANECAVFVDYNPSQGQAHAYSLGGHIPVSLSFPTPLIGWMTTEGGHVYQTIDGGASWREVWFRTPAYFPMY